MSKKAATATKKPAAKKSTKKPVVEIGIDTVPDTTKPAKQPKAEKPAKQPSRKELVWRAWTKAEDKSPKQAEAILAKAKVEGIQLNTVRGWLSAWGKGSNLPACAKK